jgi:anti-anti-sigma factor
MAVSGSLSKTAVNESAGARSQISGIVAAGATIVTLLFLTGLFEDLPEATLGALVVAALIDLVDVGALVRLYRLSTRRLGRIYGVAARPDFIAAMAAMFGVLVFDTLPGLFVGIGVSMLLLLYRASNPYVAELGTVAGTPGQYEDLERHPDSETVPGVMILRIEGPLFFANAEGVADSIRAHAAAPGIHAVVVDGETVSFVDSTAAATLANLAREFASSGVRLVLAHDVGQVRDLLHAAEAQRLVEVFYPTVQAAVDAVS